MTNHRQAPALGLGSRFGARDTGRQGADPAGPGAAAAAPAQRAAPGLARTRRTRGGAVRAIARPAVVAPGPRVAAFFAAASGGSFAAICAVLSAGWGIWQEWWLATLGLAAFTIIAMAAPPPNLPSASRLFGRCGSGRALAVVDVQEVLTH